MYDFAIIGSGVAGATIAKELGEKHRVIVIEKGKHPTYASEGKNVEVNYAYGLGGSAVYSLGNAIKTAIKGYKIEKDIYKEIWEELKIKAPDDDFLNDIDKKFIELGFEKMEKFIDFNKCNKCGECAKKLCKAKWTPLNYLKQFKGDVITEFDIKTIECNGYYEILDKNGRKVKAKNLIISAGGINSPRILKKLIDDENIGKNLFVDTFATVGGILKDSYLNKDISMLVYKKYKNFILSTHYSKLLFDEIKKDYKDVEEKDIVGIMIKIKDENSGEVLDNDVKKEITKEDFKTIVRGVSKATKYLYKLGVDDIYTTMPRGSHPGGSLSLVVDEFEVKEGLYVCDSSIFKEALGVPPIVSIIALSKKLVRDVL
ncbi:NAD(P)-binding protein [Methanocaldococcus fervens]|uniref:Glucose-methanol-choline oxidoreductase n=1 Tax=Methanocaldococcus fervens (strain DSM 4213 / JCM 15782 / AG86) TaxID=573064 RepID=C7P8E9_METFA|nr:NAD(P)-binding protein [Methanocaldococcus fervens]ACV24831.1 glucose-methanol-choline oxidoreductase [Methanocaldococcus fervens AG86]